MNKVGPSPAETTQSSGGRVYCTGYIDPGTNKAFIQVCTLKNAADCKSS